MISGTLKTIQIGWKVMNFQNQIETPERRVLFRLNPDDLWCMFLEMTRGKFPRFRVLELIVFVLSVRMGWLLTWNRRPGTTSETFLIHKTLTLVREGSFPLLFTKVLSIIIFYHQSLIDWIKTSQKWLTVTIWLSWTVMDNFHGWLSLMTFMDDWTFCL